MDIRYPIGKLALNDVVSSNELAQMINDLENAPKQLVDAVEGLTREQLATPYRPNGWKLSQVVHHLADSHMNAYMRIKLALTEEQPTVKTFEENLWAELADNNTPITISVKLFTGIHERLVTLLKFLKEAEFKKAVIHPEIGMITVEQLVAIYSWHGKHHIAQIREFRKQNNW